jgi:mannosyltransferase OCH1-like enzyme
MEIPKIIHRIWFDIGKGNKPPIKYDRYRNSVEKLNPNWIFLEWDRQKSDKFILSKYPKYYDVWMNYKSEIYRIDALRYFLMDGFGGVYIDQDLEMFESFDTLMNDYNQSSILFVRSGHNKSTITNYFMASEKGHPFWDFCIQGLAEKQQSRFFHRKSSYFGVFFVSGPRFLDSKFKTWNKTNTTLYSKKLNIIFNEIKKNSKNITILYKESFYLSGNKLTEFKKTKKSSLKIYGNHEYVFSWSPGWNGSVDIVFIVASVLLLIIIILYIYYLTKITNKKIQ